jgi:predicted Zn-ribbon and HTH transcriptional regulator
MSLRVEGSMARDDGVKAPGERKQTVRDAIRQVLAVGEAYSLRDLSELVRVSERDLPNHLEHLSRTLRRRGERLVIEPAACRSCGYLFRSRARFKRPGRCPKCRRTHIAPARFRLR